MPKTETLLRWMRDALPRRAQVEEKKMFGGRTLIVNGKMCMSARAERMMFRIDPEAHEAATARRGCRGVVMKGREYRGYVHVDVSAVPTKRAFDSWARLAIEYNAKIAPPASPRRK